MRLNLNKYFYSYLTLKNTVKKNLTIYPDGCDYLLIEPKGSYRFIKKQLRPQIVNIDQKELILIRLKPYTLKLLETQRFLEVGIESLIDEVFNTESTIEITQLIQHYLLSDSLSSPDTKKINFAVDFIYERKGLLKKEELYQIMNISPKTLQRVFNRTIGLSPKTYIDIIRFQSLITRVTMIKFNKKKIIPSCYTDYSHFYKDFKKYTGSSPKVFYRESKKHIGSIYDIL